MALGHLHVPQKVAGCDFTRYSGSPIPMGFAEAGQEKMLCQVEFDNGKPLVTEIPVPRFQELETIKGDWEHIAARLEELKSKDSTILIDIVYTGHQVMGDLRDRLDELTAHTELEILRIKNERIYENAKISSIDDETLADLSIEEVFKRCLDAHDIPAEQREELINTYREAVLLVQEEGTGLEEEA